MGLAAASTVVGVFHGGGGSLADEGRLHLGHGRNNSEHGLAEGVRVSMVSGRLTN